MTAAAPDIAKFRGRTQAGPTTAAGVAAVYLKVAGMIGAALAISFILEPFIEPDFSPLFLGAIAFSTQRWGKRAGVAGTALAIPALLTLISPPHYSLRIVSWDAGLRLLSFSATATLIIWLTHRFLTAETGLRASLMELWTKEERFRVALLKSPVIVFHQNADLRYIWVYNPLPEHTGVSLLNKVDTDLFLPEEAARLTQLKRGVLASGKGVRDEVTLTSSMGVRTMDLTLEPFTDAHGHITGLLGTAVDITDQKRHEAQLKESGERFRTLAWHLDSDHEKQRAVTSREIHDNVSQILAALDLQLASISAMLAAGAAREEICARLRDIGASLGDTLATTERISAELRPSLLDNLGLASALQSEAWNFQARTGISIVAGPLESIALSPVVSTAIFRIAEESLRNIELYSGATRVRISLRRTFSNVVLQISDDGRGIPATDAGYPGSLTLLGMRERASSVGGKITIQGRRGKGTALWVEIPICDEA